jgi:large subunit ribosomal protein L29
MNSKNIKDIKLLDKVQLEKEIIITKKELFELRFKKATRQSFQPHFFVKLKYKLRLLLMFQGTKKNEPKLNTKDITN